MTQESITNDRSSREFMAAGQFLDNPCEESFSRLFRVFNPQLVAFFRARIRESSAAEDLAQEVMLTVYSKASQIRDRTLFRAWLFKIARNALCRHYGKLTREVETVNLADVDNRLAVVSHYPGGTHAFEFRDWLTFLDARERDAMMLRFVEQWEYHEIAAAQATPIGTVQWRIFNSKKKLIGLLAPMQLQCGRRVERKRRKEKNVATHASRSEQSKKTRRGAAEEAQQLRSGLTAPGCSLTAAVAKAA